MSKITPLVNYAIAISAVYNNRASFQDIEKYKPKITNELFDYKETIFPSKEDEIVEFATLLKNISKIAVNDNNISKNEIDFLNAAISSIKTQSTSSLKKVQRASWLIGNDLNKLWTDNEKLSNENHHKILINMAIELVGKPTPFLFVDDSKLIPKEGPLRDRLKEFNKINNEARDIWKKAVSQLVANNGNEPIFVKEALNILTQNGIVRTYISPDLVKYPIKLGISKVTSNPAIFSESNEELTAIPGFNDQVIFNDNVSKDNRWILKKKQDGFTSEALIYPMSQFSVRADKKKKALDKILPHIETFVSAWTTDAKTSNDYNIRMKATCALLMYVTAARVGNRIGESGVGISTTRIKHYKLLDSEIHIKFRGKSDVKQHFKILKKKEPEYFPILYSNLLTLSFNKNAEEFMFTKFENSKLPLTGSGVNDYIQSKGWPASVGAHKIRHLRGTLLAQQIVAAKPFKFSKKSVEKGLLTQQREAELWFKDTVVQEVASLLGHKKGDGSELNLSTSIKSYIDPTFVSEFFTDKDLRIPSWVPKTDF